MGMKSFAATLGIGMLTGAAVVMMLPRRSPVYKAMNDAARTIRHDVARAVDSLT